MNRCLHCGHSLEHGALICGECGRVQPPPGEGPEWVDSEEYAVGGPAPPEQPTWTVLWAVLAFAFGITQLAVVPSLRILEASALPALGIVWAGSGLMLVSRKLESGLRAHRVATALYGAALAMSITAAGMVVLRVL